MNPTRNWPRLACNVVKHAFTDWRDPLVCGQLACSLERVGMGSLPLTLLVGTGGGFVIGSVFARAAERLGMIEVAPSLVWIVGPEYLAPVIAGLVMTCRCVSSTAAELASMGQNEEVKAIAIMGIGVERYLLAPRWLAFVLATPALTVFALLAMLMGAWLSLGLFMGLSVSQFLRMAGDQASPFDIILGLLRAVISGALMGAVALGFGLGPCRESSPLPASSITKMTILFRMLFPGGDHAGGSQINRATTGAVVGSLLVIIAVQMVFAVVLTRHN